MPLEYQSDGPHRPSFRFRHSGCGGDMGRMELANGRYLYVCDECDTRTTHRMAFAGEIERVRVS